MPAFFSVVIPNYNRKKLILATIESILQQSFSDIEVIVVDDGSTDGSYEFLKSQYAGKANIHILQQSNKERGAARNAGLKAASGSYVQFLDSDDLLLPDHFKVLHDYILRLNYPYFIATKFEFFRNNKSYASDMSRLNEGHYDYRLFLYGNPLACNICVRRDNPRLRLFEEDRRFAIKEDWMFFLQNLQDQELYIADKVTIRMLDHPERSMRSDSKLLIQKTFLATEWVMQHVKLDPHEQKALKGHANYFSAIHSYIDGNRSAVFAYLWKAIRLTGFKKKHLVLALKAIPGHRILSSLK